MEQLHTHVMKLMRTYESGAEEWHCPECGRHFMMQWPPRYKRIILEEGDDTVRHAATKGGLRLNIQVSQSAQIETRDNPEDENDFSDVGAFSEWIDQLDFTDNDDELGDDGNEPPLLSQ